MNEALERAKKHLGAGDYVELQNEDGTKDKFYLKPIVANYYADFMYITSKFNVGEGEMWNKNFTKEDYDVLFNLVRQTLKCSPDFDGMSDSEYDDFALSNFTPLMTKIFEINDLGSRKLSSDREAVKRAESIRRIREQHDKPNGDKEKTAQ